MGYFLDFLELFRYKYFQSDFMQIPETFKHSFTCGISPQILCEDRNNQQMLFEK